MAIRLRDVAERAGVSVGTVSNVLNRPDQVKPATVERVNNAIDLLGYVPNAAARQLRAGQSSSFAMLVLDVGNPFFTDVARGAELRAMESGYTLMLANSAESAQRERQYLELFETQRVAGVLISPVAEDLPRLKQLKDRGIPVVLVDRGTHEDDFASVAVDDVAGGAAAAAHLLELGRKRIAFVGGPLHIRQVADRFAGASAKVAEYEGASITIVETNALSLEQGQTAGESIKNACGGDGYDAIFAANDLLALGIQQALISGQSPLRMPQDIALIGYDDISFAAAAVVPISSIRQPRELIGSTAVDLLLRERTGGGDHERHHVVFQPELVVRTSTQPA